MTLAGVAALIAVALGGLLHWRHASRAKASQEDAARDSFAMKAGPGHDQWPSGFSLFPNDAAARQPEYEALLRLPAETLLDRWKVAVRTGADLEGRLLLLDAFGAVFVRTELLPNPRITEKLAAAIEDDRIPAELRAELVYALGQTDAVPALQALLAAEASSVVGGELREAVLDAISTAGTGSREDVRYPEDLAPALEGALRAAKVSGDAAMATAAASALARVGTETGVKAAFDLYFDENYRRKDPAGASALGEVLSTGISNPAAIPYLSAILNANPPETTGAGADAARAEMLEMAGGALLDIGTAESAQTALEWLRAAPEESAPLVNAWFASMRTPEVQSAAQQYVTDATFESEAVKLALEQALARMRGGLMIYAPGKP